MEDIVTDAVFDGLRQHIRDKGLRFLSPDSGHLLHALGRAFFTDPNMHTTQELLDELSLGRAAMKEPPRPTWSAT